MSEPPPPRGPWLTGALALLAFVGGAAGTVVFLRSFEFLPVPKGLAPYTPPAPPPAPSPPAAPAPDAPSEGVTLVVADGMRLDVSRTLPAYAALRGEGADVVTRALFPTFTRTGTATILAGCGPLVHGYMTNFNRRRAPVRSLADVARAAGVHTRYYANVPPGEPFMFPEASVEVGFMDDAAVLAEGPRPHLTLVYLREPDLSAHRFGGASDAYRAAAGDTAAWVARIRAALDLERETLIVATDHGHLDQGGHGGTEPIVAEVPLLLAGAGIVRGARLGPEGGSDLRDVAPTAAHLLGVAPPHTATGRPLYEVLADPPPEAERVARRPHLPPAPVWAAALRGLLGAVLLAALPALVLRPRPRHVRALVGAVLGAAALAVLYGLRGYPFSYSCVNAERDVPAFLLEVLALATGGHLLGAAVGGDARRWAAWALTVGAALAGAAWGAAGWGAPAGLAWPRLAFGAYLALNGLMGAGLAGLVALVWAGVAAFLRRRRRRRRRALEEAAGADA